MKRICRKVLTLLLTAALLVPAVSAEPVTDSFYEELSRLVNSQDDTFFFGTIELRIGSDILTVDGIEQQMEASAETCSSRTMLPIRSIIEATGGTADYDVQTQAVTITSRYGDRIVCTIGADTMLVNDVSVPLDVPCYIKDGRAFAPVRAIIEALDLSVAWEQETMTITITAPYQTARVLVSADTLDTSALHAETVLHDGAGLWVLQFASPAAAKNAVEQLTKQGIMAEPDLYLPLFK